jgi:hypothetical protein
MPNEQRDVPDRKEMRSVAALIHYLRFVLRGFRCFCALFCVLRLYAAARIRHDMNMSSDGWIGARVESKCREGKRIMRC